MSAGLVGEGGTGCHELRHTSRPLAGRTCQVDHVDAEELWRSESTPRYEHTRAGPSRALGLARSKQQLAGRPEGPSRRSSGSCRTLRLELLLDGFEF